MSPDRELDVVRIALPKGRMFDEVVDLLKDAGVSIRQSERGYRPNISLPHFSAKILKPRNVISMLTAGARDIGFAGAGLDRRNRCRPCSTSGHGAQPSRLVVAAPHQILENGQLPKRALVVASEYPNLAAALDRFTFA